MRNTLLPLIGAALLLAPHPAQAIDADPYCILAPETACLIDMVGSALRGLRPGYRTDEILSDYGRALALSGRPAEALAIANAIKTERSKDQVLNTLAATQASGGNTQPMTTLDASLPAEKRVVDYAMMAEASFRKDKAAEARDFLDRAKAAAGEVEAATNAPHGHYRLASALDMNGEHDAAVAAARAITRPSNSAITLIELATRRAKARQMDAARGLMDEAAKIRQSLPADKRYLPLSRAAEFWIGQGETDRALALARGAEDDEVRKGVLSGLIPVAAQSGNWKLAYDLSVEAGAETMLASVYAQCAASFVVNDRDGPNTCLDAAHDLVDQLAAKVQDLRERERYNYEDAVISLAVAESLAGNPKAVKELVASLPEDRSREHAQNRIMNAQIGRNPTLAILIALNMKGEEAKLRSLARLTRFVAEDEFR